MTRIPFSSRTFVGINTCCNKLIKLCQSYPCINTSSHTGTTPTGVDKSDGSDHHQRLFSWKGGPPCSQLGTDNSRPMGLADNNRLPPRAITGPLPGKTKPLHTVFCRGTEQDLSGGPGALRQRSNCGNTIDPGKFCFSNLLSGKEGWGAETCGKSQEPQWLCKNRALQDGGATYPSRFDPISGLDDKVGSEGCLPSDTNLSGTSTPTPIPVECQGLSVSMPPVRLNISTMGVYQGIETSSGDTETDGCPSDNLSRRHSDYASEQGGADRTNSFDMSTVQGPGFSGQHEEVPFGSRAIDRVPGFPSEFIDNVFDPPSPRKIQQDAQKLLRQETVSVRELARFLGKASTAARAVWQAPLHYRALQVMVNAVLPESQTQPDLIQKFNVQVQLTKEAREDLTWWTSLDSTVIKSPMCPRIPQLTIESDASNIGWGARQGDLTTGGVWSKEEATHHINYLELLAAFLAVRCFAREQHQITILLKLDSITAMTYINKMGGTQSQPLCQLALSLWEWCLQKEIFLVAVHLPGRENVVADQESRTVKDRCDWMLNPNVFRQIQAQMGPCEVDLFASRLTKQLPRFYSWRPDPEAEGVDAFNQDWSQVRGFANPPWCLIPRCLAQLKRQKARIVLITPLWNTQPWYPVLLELLEDFPRRLPQQADLVRCPTAQEFIMNQRVPDLIAWPISGNPLHHEAFLQRLQGSSCHHGGQRLNPTTTPYLRDGHIGVSKGIEILLLDL